MNKSFKRTIAAISMTAMLAAGFALPVSAATQVEVTGNPVMIRADAGLKNTVVSKAHKGDKYVYVGQKKDSTGRVWYNIKYSGNKTGWITSQFAKKTETSAANPVKAYEGTYQCDRATITVKASGKSDAKITVKWGSSAWENSVWEMSGMFDSSVYRVDYGNGVRTDYVYNDNGSVSSKKVAYKNSTGRVQFKDTKTLVWRDENEQDNGEMTFTKISDTATQPEQPVATAKQVQITGNPVNVRAGAGTNYNKLGKTSKGKTYTYLASKKDSSGRVWYQIQYTSKTKGWVMGSLAKLVGQTAAVKEDAFMKAIFKDVTSSDQYKEWKKMNPEATITEKLSGSTITFTVTGGLNIDGMDDEDFTNDKPVIAGKYVFKHNGDYVVYTSQDAKHLSNPFNAFILIAICDYYGMSFVTANEYIAAHPDNTYYIEDKKANTIKMYAAAKWNTATEPEQPSAAAKQVQIIGSSVNVRSGAGTNYKKLGSTSTGKKYTYLASKKASNGRVWYQIQYTSKTKGWVTSQFAKLVSTSTVDYSGEYVETIAGRATVTVTKKASGYDVWVRWPNSAAEVYNWKFSGTFNAGGVMNYTKCVKTIITFDENDNDSLKTSYTNGTGTLTVKNGTVTWKDNKENAGKDVKFVKE